MTNGRAVLLIGANGQLGTLLRQELRQELAAHGGGSLACPTREQLDLARSHRTELNSFLALIATLTPRERQVFLLMVSGMINKRIAGELGTTERTVKAHRHEVMEKLQVGSLAQLVSSAVRLGVLAADPRSDN